MDGFEVVLLQDSGVSLKFNNNIYGSSNPLLEAKEQVAQITPSHENDYVLLGLGLGYNLKLLESISDPSAKFIIIEKNIHLIYAALSIVDISCLLDINRILFIGDSGPGDTMLNFAGIAPYLALFNPLAISLKSSVDFDPQYYAQVTKDISASIKAAKVGFQSAKELADPDVFNRLDNLESYINCQLDLNYNYQNSKSVAVLVAAGPSLQKNISYLKRTNAFICAVGTSVRPLIANGIIPDCIITMDFSVASVKYLEKLSIPPQKMPLLIADARSNALASKIYTGKVIFLPDEKTHAVCSGVKLNANQCFKPAATVSHQAFCFLSRLGFGTIILCGLDLSNPYGVTHVPGIATYDEWYANINRFNTYEMLEWEQIMRFRQQLIRSNDKDGNPVYSDTLMTTYLDAFNREISSSKARVIDSTEGGAIKRGAEIMDLKTALKLPMQECDKIRSIKLDLCAKTVLEYLKENIKKITMTANNLTRAIKGNADLEVIKSLQNNIMQNPMLIEFCESLLPEDSITLKKLDRQIEAQLDPNNKLTLQTKRDLFFIDIISRGSSKLYNRYLK